MTADMITADMFWDTHIQLSLDEDCRYIARESHWAPTWFDAERDGLKQEWVRRCAFAHYEKQLGTTEVA